MWSINFVLNPSCRVEYVNFDKLCQGLKNSDSAGCNSGSIPGQSHVGSDVSSIRDHSALIWSSQESSCTARTPILLM